MGKLYPQSQDQLQSYVHILLLRLQISRKSILSNKSVNASEEFFSPLEDNANGSDSSCSCNSEDGNKSDDGESEESVGVDGSEFAQRNVSQGFDLLKRNVTVRLTVTPSHAFLLYLKTLSSSVCGFFFFLLFNLIPSMLAGHRTNNNKGRTQFHR